MDKGDPYYERARQTFQGIVAERLVTTWPCLTEAMYLLSKLGGLVSQDKLLRSIESGLIGVHAIEEQTVTRIRQLIAKYHDAPMDFADASLVVTAELTFDSKVFSFDKHFRTYLIHDRTPFEVIP